MIVAIVLLVTMSAYFSATETAFLLPEQDPDEEPGRSPATTGLLLPWTWWRTMTG